MLRRSSSCWPTKRTRGALWEWRWTSLKCGVSWLFSQNIHPPSHYCCVTVTRTEQPDTSTHSNPKRQHNDVICEGLSSWFLNRVAGHDLLSMVHKKSSESSFSSQKMGWSLLKFDTLFRSTLRSHPTAPTNKRLNPRGLDKIPMQLVLHFARRTHSQLPSLSNFQVDPLHHENRDMAWTRSNQLSFF